MNDVSLNKTKTSIPRSNPCVISRERLHQKLNQALERMLTLVVAPMGYGKTTAVLDWLQSSGVKAAWLSLDVGDNDPMVFWRYVCVALESVLHGVLHEVEHVFLSPSLVEADVHIDILIDVLTRAESEILLVIDDLHLIANPQIHKSLSRLLERLPMNAHFMCMSRTEPQMDIARYELRSQVSHITTKDLRFRGEELAEFFQRHDCVFDRGALDRIGNYSEGWAAALVAIAVSSATQMPENGVNTMYTLPDINGDLRHRLLNEVFESYSWEKKMFLLRSSILDTLQEGLCDAVTEKSNAREFLMEMSRRNEFLVSVGEENHVYRLHPIFKDFLFLELNRAESNGIADLHKKAALWYRKEGMLPQAVEHHLNGMQYKEAFELIESQLGAYSSQNQYETALRWLERLPEHYTQKSAKIALFYSLYFAGIRSFERSRFWLNHARELLREGQKKASDPLVRVLVVLATINLLFREGESGELIRFIEKVSIDDPLSLSVIEYPSMNESDVLLYRSPVHPLIKVFAQNPPAFFKLHRIARSISAKEPGLISAVQGEYFYEKNRLDEALPYFLEAMEAAQPIGYAGVLVPAMVGVARIRRSFGDLKGALNALAECEARLKTIQRSHWDSLVRALKIRYLIETGNLEWADKWVIGCKLHIYSEINRINEFELIVLARALFARKRVDDAQILLNRLLSFAEAEERRHSRVEILNLLAFLSSEKGNTLLTLQTIEKALNIGLKEGYVRSFADEKEQMLPVLKQAVRSFAGREDVSAELKAYAESLIGLIQKETRTPSSDIAHGGSDIRKLLTDKEFKVLELLYGAYTNEQIALRLNISLRTVKTHITNLYAKLNVTSRAQCVRQARETGLFE